ncbi:glycoside hydrolase family 35 protein [Jaapia argillacea MUCL 33604]|uniref:beta-galactosidase n=1 Tax=Jaapia argillacea MUCL 33604 TaxID=933084 RepID=A0A067PMU5_9AGAM|nr:glycoside hydrolase family 35 protein [Jaapia argillacea MUCL 33604]
MGRVAVIELTHRLDVPSRPCLGINPSISHLGTRQAMMKWSVLALLAVQCLPALVQAYVVPPGSPGFYHGNSSSAVTFDEYSLFLDNKRLFVFSGEVHPWRLPVGKSAWRDIFQKMKAAGWNAVSVYHHWGLTEGRQGSLDYQYYRSHVDVYEVAKEVGLLVIARPGPYINAETTGGGFPGWLTNNPAEARSNQTGFTDAWMPYITSVAQFIEPYQYPDGPVIAVQSENEFMMSTPTNPGRSEYMQLIENTYRSNGITKIPITHNDAGRTAGVYAPGSGLGEVDLYTWDNYPNGFDCSSPGTWSEVETQLDADHQQIDPDLVWASGEFGGGSFDPWGGSGYDMCYILTNEQYANVFYKNNYAAATHYQNLYMTYGGTNWGNLAEPTVYTSYDYGSPIREDHTLSPKYSELKLQAGFLHASPDYLLATRIGNGTIGSGTAFSDSPLIYTTALSSSTGANFYVVRQNSNAYLTPAQFTLRVNTTEGVITIPQYGGMATIDGRESQILVSEYTYGSHVLKYSTAEIFTQTTIDDVDYLILYAQAGHSIEGIVAPIKSGSPAPQVLGSNSIQATGVNGTVLIQGTPSGISAVTFPGSTVLIVDKHTALSFWNVRVQSPNTTVYDAAPDAPSVLVAGPYLVRNASISGTTLSLYGDLNETTTLEVIAPSAVNSVTWNDEIVSVQRSPIGSLQGTLPINLEFQLPSLKDAEWFCADSLPEIQPGFDDSAWVTANKTNTSRPYQPFAGKYVLYVDEYGFHQGNTITRGHFTGKNATGVQLSVQGGFNFGYSAWINTRFLGSSQGTNQYSANGGSDLSNDTWLFSPADLNDGDNVLTVVVDPTGLEEDYNGLDLFKTPRGVRGYTLLGGGDFDYWKVQGNLGGENFPDEVRGPLNEGGLFVERQGAHLPGFPTATAPGWNTSASCTPYSGITSAGIQAYRTTFNLDLPPNTDIPISLEFVRTPSSSYRTVIYINGWQFGKFNSRDGPQTSFPLPEGILNPNGQNELLVTLWSLDAVGAKIADVELANTVAFTSSKESVPGSIVPSPTYQQLR